MEDEFDLRTMMDYVQDTENESSPLLEFVEDSLFLESQVHSWHLQCKLYSKHMELDELYKELPEKVDTFVEGLMSTYGALVPGNKDYNFQQLDECISTLEKYLENAKIIHQQLELEQDYGSVNSLEDIISLVDSALYKLKILE